MEGYKQLLYNPTQFTFKWFILKIDLQRNHNICKKYSNKYISMKNVYTQRKIMQLVGI